MELTTEGFYSKNMDDESFYQRAYNKCMSKNSPPFMGSVSDTINYCLNNISNRFCKIIRTLRNSVYYFHN